MQMAFMPDGTVESRHGPPHCADCAAGGTPLCTACAATESNGLVLMMNQLGLTWEFEQHGGPHAENTFVRASIHGRKVPLYEVSRHEKNWGFLMESCWVVWSSFEMPLLGEDPSMADENLKVNVETQYDQVAQYNAGNNYAVYDYSSDEEQDDDDDHDDDDDDNEGAGGGALLSAPSATTIA